MEIQQEQTHTARPRAAPKQTRQTTMRASQAQINQDVAVALERVIGRLENMEQWRKEVDDERRAADRRRDTRDDLGIRLDKGTIAILISLVTTCLLIWSVAHH